MPSGPTALIKVGCFDADDLNAVNSNWSNMAAGLIGVTAPAGFNTVAFVSLLVTANAHTITATGLYQSGSAAVNLATFAAFAGAQMTLMALNAKWVVMSSIGVTFT